MTERVVHPASIDPLDLCDPAAIRLAEQLPLEPEVDRAGRDVEGQLLRLEVVLEQGHRKGQRDPGAETAGIAGEPAIDRRPGQRSAGRRRTAP